MGTGLPCIMLYCLLIIPRQPVAKLSVISQPKKSITHGMRVGRWDKERILPFSKHLVKYGHISCKNSPASSHVLEKAIWKALAAQITLVGDQADNTSGHELSHLFMRYARSNHQSA